MARSDPISVILLATDYGAEIWALYEAGELTPETPLTGRYLRAERPADVDAVLQEIEAAREEAVLKEMGALE